MLMRTAALPKKPASPSGWHPADIVAAIRKRRTSLRRLSRLNGYAAGSLRIALQRPWPKAEKIIAAALGVEPQDIWPTRYGADGKPNRAPGNPAWRKKLVAHRRRLAA